MHLARKCYNIKDGGGKMKKSIIKISSIEIENIKNTKYGYIEMPNLATNQKFTKSGEVLGIYGQNGSGKTAVIDSLYFLQIIMSGSSIPDNFAEYIYKGENKAKIHIEFTVEREEYKFEVGYFVEFSRTENSKIEISREALYSSRITGDKRTNKLPFVEYLADDIDSIFTPKKRLEEVFESNKDNKINLLVAKKIAKMNGCSYIFGVASREVFFKEFKNDFSEYSFLIQALFNFAILDLIVIRNSHSGAISADFLLPVAFRIDHKQSVTKGDFVIALKEPTIIEDDRFDLLQRIVKEINVVIKTIIPGMEVGVEDYGQQLLENGSMGRKIDLISLRDGVKIPIRLESEGIVKIVSIMNVLIRAYNKPSICLAVDELDAGIYEYLLGELLSIYSEGAKGQLIFTSHNLRPLEMLDKNFIIFSTANSLNRYIRIPNIRNSNNLRDVYLRSITLGGQKECIYSETDSLKIARAFRTAGRELMNAD